MLASQIFIFVFCLNILFLRRPPMFFSMLNSGQKTVDALLAEFDLGIELVFVDDDSRDSTLELLRRAAKDDPRIHYVSFSRNFGKEAAIYAGLRLSSGDYLVFMDADLQDPPALLPQMYESLQSG